MNEVYSVKCYPNLLVYTCYDINQAKPHQYVVSKDRNDIHEMLEHLEQVENQIGFGNLSFDYYILHSVIDARSFIEKIQPAEICNRMYRVAENIKAGDYEMYGNKFMSQLDLESFFGFKSGDKSVTLTDLKILLGEYSCSKEDIRFGVHDEQIGKVLMECIADVRTLLKLYYLAIGKNDSPIYKNKNFISARYKLCEEASISATSYSPTSFARAYFLKIYKNLGGEGDVSKLIDGAKKNPTSIKLADCIPYYATFYSKVFGMLVDKMLIHSNNSDQAFSCALSFGGIPLKFGIGGVHGCAQSGKYLSDDESFIVDIDIVSMYATVATDLSIYPQHMGDPFVSAMKQILNKRIVAMNKNDNISNATVDIIKKTLNTIYGKTREPESPFYDIKYSTKVTICAQLFMARFMEALSNRIPGIEYLMVNTDAITFKCKRSMKDNVIEALKKMRELLPSLRFKIKNYEALFIKDVNNYLGYYGDDITSKGIFNYDLDLNKDNSMMIIPKALQDVLIHGEMLSDVLEKYNIDDFLIKAKAAGNMSYGHIVDNVSVIDPIQNPTRFYYSKDYKNSGYLTSLKNGVYTKISDNYPVTIMNEKKDKIEFAINDTYYRSKIVDILLEVNHAPKRQILF